MKKVILLFFLFFLFFIKISYSQEVSKGEYRLEINIPSCTLSVYKNGKLTARYPVAVGSPKTPTPLGKYYIVSKELNPVWYPPWPEPVKKIDKNGKEYIVMEYPDPIPAGPDNPLGKCWMGLDREELGIHSTNNPQSVGYSVSHGCIRMSPKDVSKVYDIVKVGTRVDIIYKTSEFVVDDAVGQIFLAIFPDVYSKGKESLQELTSRLDETKIPYDLNLVKNTMKEGTGKFNLISRSFNFILEGVQKPVNSIYPMATILPGKNEFYISMKDWNKFSPWPVQWNSSDGIASIGKKSISAITYQGKGYISLIELSKILDMECLIDYHNRIISLYSLIIHLNGKPIGPDGNMVNGKPYISAKSFSDALGIKLNWNSAAREVTFGSTRVKCSLLGGKAFIPVEALLRDFSIQMEKINKRNIELFYPVININGISFEKRGFLYKGEVYLPLRDIISIMGIDFTWNPKEKTALVGGKKIIPREFNGTSFLTLTSLYELGFLDISRLQHNIINISLTRFIVNDKIYPIMSYKDGTNQEIMILLNDFLKIVPLNYELNGINILIEGREFKIRKNKEDIYLSLSNISELPGFQVDYDRDSRTIRIYSDGTFTGN